MRGLLPALEALGARLVLIGNGSVVQAQGFQRRYAEGATVLTDPDRGSYQALGLRRDLGASLNPANLLGGIAAFARGYRQTGVEGDPAQMGGVFVVNPGGEILYGKVFDSAAERPDQAAILAALSSGRNAGR